MLSAHNVKNILSIHGGWDFATILYSLAEVGYSVEYGLLNSKFHGVPQNRERVYIVAYRHFRAGNGRKVFPVECGNSKAIIRLIGGNQGSRVYDPNGIGITLTASAGGFGGKTGLYFIDLTREKPQLTENARCIKARYSAGVTNRGGDNSGVLCLCNQCHDRENCISFIEFRKGNPKLRDNVKCIMASYRKSGVNRFGSSCGVFYGCRAVLTPEREKKRQNGRRFKECGEPSFCVTTQDRNGVYLCACSSCEKARPAKNGVPNCDNNLLLALCNENIPFFGCGRIRRLTPRECWRLQGFTDNMFDKAAEVNSDNQLYKQAGNGVTVTVVYSVGQRIVEIENELKISGKE